MVTGGAGFLGTVVVRDLEALGADVRVVRSADHDLRLPDQARAALDGAELVVHLAANVGGIGFNRRNPAPLVHDNLAMTTNVFEQARQAGVSKLVTACTVCAYPKFADAPFREEDLWKGYPEETNAPYGLAKKMMLVLSEAYRQPVRLRLVRADHRQPVRAGRQLRPGGLARDRGHDPQVRGGPRGWTETVTLWGTGTPSREFLYVDDASRAAAAARPSGWTTSEPVNVGVGRETRIRDLAEAIEGLVGFAGETVWDESRPDGQAKRFLDTARARELMGFEAQTSLEDGLRRTIDWFRDHGR